MVTITWLGHTSFSFQLETGEVILVDPWIEGNPKFPANYSIDRVDTILITHGHFDHIGGVRKLAAQFSPQIFANYEICTWLGAKTVANCNGMNKGGRVSTPGGLGVTMTHALHSSGLLDDDGSMVYGGEAAGFVLHFPDGRNAYFAGDTDVFSEMSFIRELHAPLFTMSPRGAAIACRLLECPEVIPMHFGTFPPLVGTPGELTPGVAYRW